MRRTLVVTGMILLSMAGALTTSVFARQTRQDPDVLSALLTEVRGLRAAIEQMSSTSARVQLAMGRLQLNEQRIANYGRRLDEVRVRRVEAELQLPEKRRVLANFLEDIKDMAQPVPKELQEQHNKFKAEFDAVSSTLQQLRNEEAVLTREIATEQDRWTEINRTLDELDRMLIRK